eukprot:2961473-Amphidinium_carterae.2
MDTLNDRAILPDRCVQGGIQNVVVGVDVDDADAYLNPGKMETITRSAGWLKSDQGEGEADVDDAAMRFNNPHLDALNDMLPIWCAMVTLNLSPKDPRFNCQDARDALKKERDGLVIIKVKQDHPEHHHARLFPLVGIKHWEDEALRAFKGRIVLGGRAIHSATQHIDFQEVGTTPAAVESARIAMIAAFADEDGGESRVIQSDAPQAYLQASFLQK